MNLGNKSMNTTILLSEQRCGTTYLSNIINGMSGQVKSGYYELFFKNFFIENNLMHLVKCDLEKFDENFHYNLYDTSIQKWDKCYYDVSENTINEAVNKCRSFVFKIQLFQILNKVNIVKKIKSPVLYLIRKNQWQRNLSMYCHENNLISTHITNKNTKKVDVKIDKDIVKKRCEYYNPIIKSFQKELKNQKNVKTIYYEDIQNKEYWTDEFINELEDFMKVKFTDRNYIPPFKKTRNFVNIINEAEIMDDEMIKKYYIKEI